MTFLAPTAAMIAAALTMPALLAMYFLKRKRQMKQISSTFLWRKALNDLEVNAPFQRIRRNLLLLLQLLILAAALLAFGRPALRQASTADERVVIVIDHSGSMNALDVSPTRLLAAREQAKALVDDLGESPAMIIRFAVAAGVVEPFTTDRTALRRAIDSIVSTDERSNIQPALRLIEPFAMEHPGKLTVYVLSDGAIHDGEGAVLRAADIRYVRIGQEANNLGIVALAARRDVERPEQVRVLVRLAGSGEDAKRANVTLKVDGQVHHVLRASADAGGGSASLQFELTASQGAFLEVSHDYADDLVADNRGALVLAPPRRLRVMLISGARGNAMLARAIRAAGVAELLMQHPDRYEQHADRPLDFDVLVFDRYSPKALPRTDSLYFNVAPPMEGLTLTASEEEETENAHAILDWRRDHELLRHVSLGDMTVLSPGRLALPDGAVPLATADTGPVMAMVDHESVHHLIVGFDVLKTDWPMRVSFPVFVTNALNWLSAGGGSDAAVAYRPGDAAVVPYAASDNVIEYDGPARLVAKATGSRATLPAFTRAGIYYAQGRSDPPWDRLAVNMVDETESDLTSRDVLPVGVEAGGTGSGEVKITRQDVWPWFIWGALGVLLVEWVVYTRRMHL